MVAARLPLLLLCAAALSSCGRWPPDAVAETKRRGDVVCEALARYKASSGTLPRTLSELAPGYLPSIPQPTVGRRRWIYRTYHASGDYRIAVETLWDSQPLLERSADEDWFYDTK